MPVQFHFWVEAINTKQGVFKPLLKEVLQILKNLLTQYQQCQTIKQGTNVGEHPHQNGKLKGEKKEMNEIAGSGI